MSNPRITTPAVATTPAPTAPEKDEAPAQPFPLHCLPPQAQAMARAICKTERVPATLAGVCVLGFLSASIGRGLQIQSAPARLTRGNLYLAASAESGSGKSETYRHAAKPFFEFEAEFLKSWRTSTLPRLQAERDILEEEIAELKKMARKSESALQRDELKTKLAQKKEAFDALKMQLHAPGFSVEDVTVEKLAVLLSQRGETLASLSADAGSIVNNLLGKNNKLQRTDESIYLKGFSGDFCRVDRVSAEPVLLNSPCLSALWLTQPDKVDSLLAERSLSDGGLIPRMLPSHTRCEPQHIQDSAPIPAPVAAEYRALIRSLLESYRLATEPFTIHPSAEAKGALDYYFNRIVDRRNSDLHDVTIYAARWGEQAWRIAVCLHAGKWGPHAHEQPLELDTANDAIALADWFSAQQLEILAGGREKAKQDKRDKVLALLVDKPSGIRATDVYRARFTHNAEAAHTLLAQLETQGVIAGINSQPEGGGHITRLFTLAKK